MMAAVAIPLVDPWETDRSARPGAAVYRRRRAVTLLVLLVALAGLAAASRRALVGPGGGALTTTGPSGVSAPRAASATNAYAAAPAAAARHFYTVKPGDTLWSIVESRGQAGDPRPEVDRLALQLDGRPLQVGQRLYLP